MNIRRARNKSGIIKKKRNKKKNGRKKRGEKQREENKIYKDGKKMKEKRE